MSNSKRENRLRRHKRVRAKIKGTNSVPRVSVFRSSKHMFVQIIDDSAGKTILSNSIEPIPGPAGPKARGRAKSGAKGDKTETAGLIGEMLARKAKEVGISKVVFDRGGYKYHGRVRALAEGLRRGGLKF